MIRKVLYSLFMLCLAALTACSGTTIAGLRELELRGFRGAVIEAVQRPTLLHENALVGSCLDQTMLEGIFELGIALPLDHDLEAPQLADLGVMVHARGIEGSERGVRGGFRFT